MTLPAFLRRMAGILGGVLGLGLAGCDDGTAITRVLVYGDAASFLVLSGPGGMPVEVHGAPFPGVAAKEVAALLKAPAAMPAGIRFRPAEPGDAEGARLMLVFNRTDTVDAVADCRRRAPARPPGEGGAVGFTVTMTLCNAGSMVATAHMEASKTRADDPAEFTRVMRLLMMQIATKPG